MREIIAAVVLALVTCIGFMLLPEALARGAVSNLLTLVAAIYIGFSIASRGKLSYVQEVLGCGFFVCFSLLGLWFSWWFLVAGFGLHGIWDIRFHRQREHDIVPIWYP